MGKGGARTGSAGRGAELFLERGTSVRPRSETPKESPRKAKSPGPIKQQKTQKPPSARQTDRDLRCFEATVAGALVKVREPPC